MKVKATESTLRKIKKYFFLLVMCYSAMLEAMNTRASSLA